MDNWTCMDSWIVLSLFFSVVCAAVFAGMVLFSVLSRFARFILRKPRWAGRKRRFLKSKLLWYTAILIFAIWSMRLAVGLYAMDHTFEEIPALKPFETFLNSFIHTLQTFSMDESYENYLIIGKTMMADLCARCSKLGDADKMCFAYGIYSMVLNVMAPVAGGAIILELLSEFFPKVRLFFSTLCVWRKKYYFSKLNDNSLALAKSILAKKRHGVCIIFADVYTDKEEESGSERLAEARLMGAICLRDDLLHIKYRGWRSPKIFLIDGSENSNLQSLTALLESSDRKVNRSEIYVFASDKGFSRLDEEVAFIVNGAKRAVGAKKRFPAVIPVNGVRNMVTNLFMDVPLFEPIIGKAKEASGKRKVTVTILGSGVIGTELFLTTYWCGQMLDCELHINVISKEKQNQAPNENPESAANGIGDFEGRINHINPDIFETGRPASALLKYAADAEPSEPYFFYSYRESDVTSDNFISLMQDPQLLDTDYFIVALGSDEENFAVANRLRQVIGAHHLYHAPRNKTVIAYVIYNSDLCRALDRDSMRKYSTAEEEKDFYDVYMHAFGNLEDVYSMKNVFFNDLAVAAGDVGESFELQNMRKAAGDGTDAHGPAGKKASRKKAGRFRDIYSYQANLAKMCHRKYREFSAEFHDVSIFAIGQKKNYDAIEAKYLHFLVCKKKTAEDMEKLHKLAWLEHRRWCAYMRTMGYRRPEPLDDPNMAPEEREIKGYKKYCSLETSEHKSDKNKHKFAALKLHPCLVECSKKGMQAEFDEYGFQKKVMGPSEESAKDALDKLSLEIKPDRWDFKAWDYPEKELSKAERQKYMKKRMKEIKKQRKSAGA